MSNPIFPNNNNQHNQPSNLKFPSTEKIERLFKERYESEHARKENLDKKANNLLVGATTSVTIYGGFGILSKIDFLNNSAISEMSLVLLVSGLVALISGIIFSTISLSLRDYWKMMDPNDFGSVINDKFFLEKRPDELRKKEPTLLSAMTINGYIEMTLRNEKINNRKAKQINVSQILFIIGIASIPLYLISLGS